MNVLMSCGFIVTRGQPLDEFLLMIHADRLDLPKGHVDPGESEMECALRELVEETGIRERDIEVDPDFRFELKYDVVSKHTNFQPQEKTLVIFWGRLVNDVEIEVTEHLGFEWRKWDPPHSIQEQTIDPLLNHLENHLAKSN